MNHAHLGLSRWPFQTVPSPDSVKIWADREQAHRDMRLLLRTYSRTDASTINLLWAYFGAGKTHFLQHMGYRAETENLDMKMVYTVFPKAVRSFLDLYRTYISSLDLQTVATSAARNDGDAQQIDPELVHALRTILVNPAAITTVRAWLEARSPLMKDVRALGLVSKIDSSERAVEVLASLLRLQSATEGRVVWAIDEFQRIGELKESQRSDLNIGLHTLYNAVPIKLSLLLSFSFGDKRNIKYLLSDELIDRANLERYVQLPAMTTDDALAFVRDLLEAHRPAGWAGGDWYPFGEQAALAVIQFLEKSSALQLKPRTVMQAFNAVLTEGDLALEDKEITEISADFATSVLSTRLSELLDDE